MRLLLLSGAALAAWGVVVYNRLVRDRNRVRTAWSDIDIQLKRRHDLIPKLVAAVEAYACHERATLAALVELRGRAQQVAGAAARGDVEAQVGTRLHRLAALVEDYPELKADQGFRQLQSDLSEIEDHIQYARRYYNGAVRNLNIRIESFPDLLLARLFRFTPEVFFGLESAGEAAPPDWPPR